MSTQYNSIQGPYGIIRTYSIAYMERENVHSALTPYIKNANVLELACGSGFYTPHFLKWGAHHVVGVDISPVMLDEAQRQVELAGVTANGQKTAEFHLGDVSKPVEYPGGPFDVVCAAWLLNYAPDKEGLVDMFRTISRNLKPGGRFVGVTPPPSDDPKEWFPRENAARPPPHGSGGLYYEYLHDVENGVHVACRGHTELGDVYFENYHLKEETYIAAMKEGGMGGEMKWGTTEVPERYLRGEGDGEASLEEIKSYLRVPNYGILVVAKD